MSDLAPFFKTSKLIGALTGLTKLSFPYKLTEDLNFLMELRVWDMVFRGHGPTMEDAVEDLYRQLKAFRGRKQVLS